MIRRVLEWLFPPKCILCRDLLAKEETDLCRRCRTDQPEYHYGKKKVPHVADLTAVWRYEGQVRKSLFQGEVPIYTKVRDEVPTRYGKNCEVANCVVADGCRLDGFAENSIIFREVKIAEGAEVKDTVVMQGCVIEAGASVQYAILDKNVTVTAGTKLLGSPEHPLIIRKGVTV